MRPSVRGRGCRGVSAIEFALISPIFFSVVCIFFEMSLILFTQSVLDDATRYAARFVKTRQVTTGTAFKTAVCAEIGAMIPCADVQYYVQSGNTFSAMNATVQTNAQGNMTSNGMFFPGTGGQNVVVQVGYNRPSIIPWAAKYLNNSRLMISTMAFQNEP